MVGQREDSLVFIAEIDIVIGLYGAAMLQDTQDLFHFAGEKSGVVIMKCYFTRFYIH